MNGFDEWLQAEPNYEREEPCYYSEPFDIEDDR